MSLGMESEVPLQVRVEHLAPASDDRLTDLIEGIVRLPSRTEAVRAIEKICFENRLENEHGGHLDYPVAHGRDAQGAFAPIRFGDVDTAYRKRTVLAGS